MLFFLPDLSMYSRCHWETHEKKTLLGLNLLMLTLFHEHLQGASLSSVRESLGLVLPKEKDIEIKATFGVHD